MAKETFSSLIDLFKTSSPPNVSTLVCDVCGHKLSVFRRKKPCAECKRLFCSQCLERCRDRAYRCKNCHVLTMRPPLRAALLNLRVKDLQHYLNQHNVSTRGCIEKEDLVNVLYRYASSPGNPPSESTGNSQTGNQGDRPATNFVNSQPGQSSRYSGNPPTTTPSSSSSNNFRPQQESAAAEPIPGDSDSSSDTSFEIVQRPSSDENIASVHSSTSSASVSTGSKKDNNVNSSPMPTSVSTNGQPESRSDEEEIAPNTAGANMDFGSARTTVSTEQDTSEIANTSADQNTASGPDTESVSSDETTPVVGIESGTSSTGAIGSMSNTLGVSDTNWDSSSSHPNSASNSPNLLRGTMASIKSETDFEALSVKQLKDILHRHRVNYHGCCEKAELVERAKRLYRDYCSSRADLEKLDLDSLCKICMDAPVECVMLECGHMATCTDCGRQLSECPICRQFVVRIVRTFKA